MSRDKRSTADRKLNCIAFYKGDQISDWLLAYVVNAATRGKITKAGRRLYLIPVQHYERARLNQQRKADEYAKRRRKKEPSFKSGPASPSIKKVDCIPLTNFLPKSQAQLERRLLRIAEFGPLYPMPPHPKTVTHIAMDVDAKRNAKCVSCGASLAWRRRQTKYCSSGCKQAAYRLRLLPDGLD